MPPGIPPDARAAVGVHNRSLEIRGSAPKSASLTAAKEPGRRRGARTHAQCHSLFPIREILRNLWGRMVSCGRVVLGLVGIFMLVGRPSATRPQVANLPHTKPRARLNRYRCPVVGKPSGIAHSCARRASPSHPRAGMLSRLPTVAGNLRLRNGRGQQDTQKLFQKRLSPPMSAEELGKANMGGSDHFLCACAAAGRYTGNS
jgi:hypothetical protein